MIYSVLNKLFNYEKRDNNDEEEEQNLTQSCSDGEDDSEDVSVSIGTSKVGHSKFITFGTSENLTKSLAGLV